MDLPFRGSEMVVNLCWRPRRSSLIPGGVETPFKAKHGPLLEGNGFVLTISLAWAKQDK